MLLYSDDVMPAYEGKDELEPEVQPFGDVRAQSKRQKDS